MRRLPLPQQKRSGAVDLAAKVFLGCAGVTAAFAVIAAILLVIIMSAGGL